MFQALALELWGVRNGRGSSPRLLLGGDRLVSGL